MKPYDHHISTTGLFATLSLTLLSFTCTSASTGLAPEVVDLNAEDVSYALEQKLPDLETPYISSAPDPMADGIRVGQLNASSVNAQAIVTFAESLAQPAADPKSGQVDSFLLWHDGELLLESNYRRGRANYPHYQMSITKSYTTVALGRAIQLGHLSMSDLDKPIVSFLTVNQGSFKDLCNNVCLGCQVR